MIEENKNIIPEENESKAKKFWKRVEYGALALFLALITVTVVCL